MKTGAEHVQVHATLHPVYIDNTSGLEPGQVSSLNTILFSHYRRFRRAATTTEEDEPKVLNNLKSHTLAVRELVDKSYDDVHTLYFVMSLKGHSLGSEVLIGDVQVGINGPIYQSGGTGSNNSESLPGTFIMENGQLIFKYTRSSYNNTFACYLFWRS